MILLKSQLFKFFLNCFFWVQAVHLEEKVRISASTHFENKWGSLKKVKKLDKCAISSLYMFKKGHFYTKFAFFYFLVI